MEMGRKEIRGGERGDEEMRLDLKTQAQIVTRLRVHAVYTQTHTGCNSSDIIRFCNGDVQNQTNREEKWALVLLSSRATTSVPSLRPILLPPPDRTLPAAAVMENLVSALIVHYLPSAPLVWLLIGPKQAGPGKQELLLNWSSRREVSVEPAGVSDILGKWWVFKTPLTSVFLFAIGYCIWCLWLHHTVLFQ